MPTTDVEDARDVVETWECTGEGTVWVWMYDQRQRGYVKHRIGGSQGSKRLRITVDDRRYNEEQIIEEMAVHNPFRNGLLRLVSKSPANDVDTRYHLTYDDLRQMLEIRDDEPFKEALYSLESELIVRRLKAVAEKFGTIGQLEAINEMIEERWKVGGTQKTVQEMIDAGEQLAGTRLSG